jgi:sigma-B regulation protein RsbU (phosphoserine phosphatase)
VVLLVDDQPIIGEAIRRMLSGDEALDFQYCRDPGSALTVAADTAPTVVLLDLVMPEINGLEVLRQLRADERFRELPIIVLSTKEEAAVKAEAFALGANDYLVKLPDRVELVARIRHHSRGYIALLERNLAFEELRISRAVLAEDLASAARYVRSLLPPPGDLAGIRADWRFIPSADLGGDAFGYHRLDADHVAIYLLDVCGHGVGAALLSVSALNAVRGESLPNTDFRDPGAVLTALNRAFPMERHNDMFFTMWYGVYDRRRRSLRWAGGGHPPALLTPPGSAATQKTPPATLDSDNPLLGAIEGLDFSSREVGVPPESTLYLFSDGAFEITQPDGSMGTLHRFQELLASQPGGGETALDSVVEQIRTLAGGVDLADDLSILAVTFG